MKPVLAIGILASAAGVGLATRAQAQASTQEEARDTLEEVVVTSTRQTSTVNKVAMAVTAVTQEAIDNQGIKSVAELARTVPGMTFSRSGGESNPNITIRGIGGNGATVGSATTGVYLDDSPLQRRNVNGLITGNGSPFPQLFDLERVEVLRGPQGTLYGGSSQGGTMRFITPTPSLTSRSGQASVEFNMIDGGGGGRELAGAIGLPLIQDRLGVRLSAITRKTGGWMDAYSKYDGHKFASNYDWTEANSFRATAKLQINDKWSATPAYYYGYEHANDSNPASERTASQAINFTGGLIRNGGTTGFFGTDAQLAAAITAGQVPAGTRRLGAAPSVGGVTMAAGLYPSCTLNQTAAQSACVTSGGVVFAFPDTTMPAFTQNAQPWYGDLKFDSANGRYYTTSNVQYVNSPRTTRLNLPSLTFDFDGERIAVKAVSSYTNDRTDGMRFAGGGASGRVMPRRLLGTQPCQYPYNATSTTATTCYLNADYFPGMPDSYSYYFYFNDRHAFTQELRFSSQPGDSRLSWIGGLYFNDSKIHMHGAEHSNEDQMSLRFRGMPEAWIVGNQPLPADLGMTGNFYQTGLVRMPNGNYAAANMANISDREIRLREKEMAAFGEVTFAFTDELKLTAGVRLTDYKQIFDQKYGGAVAGIPLAGTSDANPAGFVPATDAGLAANSASATSTAFTPITNPFDLRAMATNVAGCPSAKDCPYQYTHLEAHEKPVSPKVGLSWQFTPNNLAYATYSQGFRAGGVNPAVPPGTCAQDLADLGLTGIGVPKTFKGDTVSSYEVGLKTRLGGRVQVNTSAFYIDWNDMQFNMGLRCGFAFVNNAGHAVSQGVDVQADARLGPFLLNGAFGYNKAEFADDVRNPSSGALLQRKGDNVGVPELTLSAGVQYGFTVFGDRSSFIRIDYQYTGKYDRNPGVGVSTYDPITHRGGAVRSMNARAGVKLAPDVDLQVFAQNLTNSRDLTSLGHGQDSLNTTETHLRPRMVGAVLKYRF